MIRPTIGDNETSDVARHRCDLYRPGHNSHWIMMFRHLRTARRPAAIRDIAATGITIDFDGHQETWYHHRPWSVVKVLVEGNDLAVVPECTSIVSASSGGPWIYCSREPLTACRVRLDR